MDVTSEIKLKEECGFNLACFLYFVLLHTFRKSAAMFWSTLWRVPLGKELKEDSGQESVKNWMFSLSTHKELNMNLCVSRFPSSWVFRWHLDQQLDCNLMIYSEAKSFNHVTFESLIKRNYKNWLFVIFKAPKI